MSLASLFEAAEQAAVAGDFAAAARALGEAARAQQATLGPDHPDLANTLNNLAVAHERSGRPDDAEREYRRAYAIAAAALPADDPLVATSLLNLREFCEANGRPLEPPALRLDMEADISEPAPPTRPRQPDTPTVPIEPLAITFADAAGQRPRGSATAARPPASPSPAAPVPAPARPAPPASAKAAKQTAPPPAATPASKAPVAAPPKPQAAAPSPAPRPAPAARPTPAAVTAPPAPEPASTRSGLSIPVWIAIGAIVVLLLWLVLGRVRTPSAAEPDDATPPSAPAAERPVAPSPGAGSPAAASPSAAPAATAPAPMSATATPAPAVAPPTTPPREAAPASGAAGASAGGVTVGDAQLCASLAANYQCKAAGSPVRAGSVVFYTRLIADANTSVVHRWYRGDQLRQAVRLNVPARRQGFRTYSRTTVPVEGDWRVELRTSDGTLLHTERFTVR